MMRIALIALASILVIPNSQLKAQDEKDFSLNRLTDDLYHFRGGTGGNHFGTVLVTDEGIVVVDTVEPKSALWLKNELAKRFNQPVKYVIFSHSHYDHIGGSKLFKEGGAIIIAHENAEAEILEEERTQQWMSKREIVLPDIAFSDKFVLKIGDKTVNLISLGSGHTDSLIVAHFVEDRTIHLVDVASIKQVGFMTLGRPIKKYIPQLEKAMALDFDLVVPGHAALGEKQDVRNYIDYLTTLISQVENAISEGKTLEETQQILLGSMAEFNYLKRWDEWFLLNVTGVYLQIAEGEASD
ncbi:MAG: MBL fold metallo-hydrolase [Woeseia sp.]|jgi:glyoxylase-like metal-dependent hydrolase (beta-lactamase superfamily II)|nr:MBL fold metallo-hydrolase [Woeseia sp.]